MAQPGGDRAEGAVGTISSLQLGWTKPSSPPLIIQQIAFPATPEDGEEPLTFIDIHLVLGTRIINNTFPGLRSLFNCQSPVCLYSS